MRISDWSSDVCSSDLPLLQHIAGRIHDPRVDVAELLQREEVRRVSGVVELEGGRLVDRHGNGAGVRVAAVARVQRDGFRVRAGFAVVCRSEEHTSELQSLMCTPYAVFCLTKKT